MLDFYRILELDNLLCNFQNNSILAIGLIEDLLNGRRDTSNWLLAYQTLCDDSKIAGIALTGESVSDDVLLNQLLDACDPDVLVSMAAKYGTSSRLGKMIANHCRAEECTDIAQGLKQRQTSFYQLLVKLIEKKGYRTDADYYNTLRFSRQTFSRLRDPNYKLSRENALWLTLGLVPDYWEGTELLRAAGFSLRRSDRREYIILYVMRNGPYTLQELNEMLVYFEEEPIGCM